MKAEDTIIEGGVKQTLKINWSNTITGHLLGWQPTIEPDAQDKFDEFIRQIRLEQAEISFPLGEQKGRREVVKEVGYLWKPQHHNLCYGVIQPHPDCICCKWQAKLKEWGIE